MKITSDFYGGSIEIINCRANAPITLRLRRDPQTRFAQSFYFGLSDCTLPCTITIEDVDQSSFPKGWNNYQAFASHDQKDWSRCETQYQDGNLLISHKPSDKTTYYAYFPPYLDTHHFALLEFCRHDPRTKVEALCASSDTDTVELISVGCESVNAPRIWILARQHPGETQPSWWMEGFVRLLLDPQNQASLHLLAQARFHIIPNMNPDGSRIGNYRTNIHGQNLNASWDRATLSETPAVYCVIKAMETFGVDFCLDIHGDEEIPYVFIASVDRKLPLPPKIITKLDLFERQLCKADPFYKRQALEREHIKAMPAAFCAPYVMKRFNIPAVTLELPFRRYNADGFSAQDYGINECMRSGRFSISILEKYLDEQKMKVPEAQTDWIY